MRLLYKSGPMESLRKWFYKPKRDDRSLLAQFFFADDALNMVAAELDSFDGRKDPERCSTLVNQLRHAQDRVLNITSQIMDQVLGDERVARGFRVKFPEDVLQDNLAGQLWFGAECLAAGSSIMNREEESAAMRPLAKALTRSLETVRALLRDQCLRARAPSLPHHDEMLHETLRIFDRLFAEFELYYVSAMVTVKTPHEFEAQQLICVLFSETLRRALKHGLLTQEQVDSYDPALMFAVPRMAIVSGLLIYSSGPLSIDKAPDDMSEMFRPFRTLLHKIRSLLWTLERRELRALERLLCSAEDAPDLHALNIDEAEEPTNEPEYNYPDITEIVYKFYDDHKFCRDSYSPHSSEEQLITEGDYLPDNIEVMMPIIDGLRRLSEVAEPDPDDKSQGSSTVTAPEQTLSDPDTFHTNDNHLDTRTKKISRGEGNELSSLRNLSTNGLMMFDPLAINAVSSDNRQVPDNDLVTSLNEQVTEIADRLSSIAANEVDLIEHNHSFSANDVPTLISTECDEAFGFSGPRNEQLSCLPSTSHGYLIPNAISHEPAVLSSLSHNNSAVFNQDDNIERNIILHNDLTQIVPENIGSEIVNSSIYIANANLNLLLNDEVANGDNTSFHSAKTTLDNDDKVKFMLGYESDHESPADSGVSTENTSLDRSPDTDQNKELKEDQYMQNGVINVGGEEKTNVLESSFSETVNLNYTEQETQKNEAGSSNIDNVCNIDVNIDDVNIDRVSSDGESSDTITSESIRVLRDWGIEPPPDRKAKKKEKRKQKKRESATQGNTSSASSRHKKTKSKKKKKMWSPGCVIIDNRSNNLNSPLRLNLDHFVDESGCMDDEQIAIALQAQELAARHHARDKFKSSEDLIHRLFVCIAGVADQLQTNFAADLRNILKSVFLMNQTPDTLDEPDQSEQPDQPEQRDQPDRPDQPDQPDQSDATHPTIEYEATEDQVIQNGSSFDSVYSAEEVYADGAADCASAPPAPPAPAHPPLQPSASAGDLTYNSGGGGEVGAGGGGSARAAPERAPEWVPDIAAPACMRCAAHFTAFRRRHHCRNCGKVFCASCSSNCVPLPRFGQLKPVRVCEECFRAQARRR